MYQAYVKPTLDVLLASIALIILFVPMLLVAVWIKLDSRGPVLFRQLRSGKNRVPFTVYKFRSMATDAPADSPTNSLKNAHSHITRSGKIIRKLSIDELPQLINVLKGEMSFVGPRPEWNELCCEYMESIPYYNLRHLIKPGVTGWAQVMYPYGISVEDAYRKLEYDLYYMKHQDLMMDLKIVFRTVKTVLFAQGR